MNQFIHATNDAHYGKPHDKNAYTRYVSGYEPCKTCGQHPAFFYNSAKPKQIIVETCDHITERVRIKKKV